MSFELLWHDISEAFVSAEKAMSPFVTSKFSEIGTFLLKNSILAIFICLALGYLLGKVKIGSFTIGSTVGTMLIGILISLALSSIGTFEIDALVKTIFFDMFIFIVGYEVGPSFFASMKSSGWKLMIQAVFFGAVAFGISIALFKIFKVEAATAGGILAGSLTQSAIIGTADSTLKTLLTGDKLAQAEANFPVAFALTYVFGTIGTILFMKIIAPKLYGQDLKTATKEKIQKLQYKESSGNSSVVSTIKARAFNIKSSKLVGKKIADLESELKLTVEALFRNNQKIEYTLDTILSENDIITVIGDISQMIAAEKENLEELSDEKYLSLSLTRATIVLTKEYEPGEETYINTEYCTVCAIKRNGKDIDKSSELKRGDELDIVGSSKGIEKIAKEVGYKKDSGDATDVSYMSLGIIIGILIGTICFMVKGIPITLGSGGGCLVAGLLFGYYQNKHGRHGLIPASTRWFLKSVGLNVFIGIVGLMSGASLLEAIKKMGIKGILIGIAITLFTNLISFIFGRFVLKLDLVDLTGSQAGAGTCTAALNALIDETGSSVYALSYTPGYAVGNILLTILGPLVIAILL